MVDKSKYIITARSKDALDIKYAEKKPTKKEIEGLLKNYYWVSITHIGREGKIDKRWTYEIERG